MSTDQLFIKMAEKPILSVRCRSYWSESVGIDKIADRRHQAFLLEVSLKSDEKVSFRIWRSYTDFKKLSYSISERLPEQNVKFPVCKPSIKETSKKDVENHLLTSAKAKIFTVIERYKMQAIEGSIEMIRKWSECLSTSTSSQHLQISESPSVDFIVMVEEFDFYLQTLLSHDQIVSSEEFISFLDPAVVLENDSWSTKANDSEDNKFSTHEFLLKGLPVEIYRLDGAGTKNYKIFRDQIVIWKFHTPDYQAEFSVELNGISKISRTTSSAEHSPQYGAMTADEDGILTIAFTAPMTYSESYLREKQILQIKINLILL